MTCTFAVYMYISTQCYIHMCAIYTSLKLYILHIIICIHVTVHRVHEKLYICTRRELLPQRHWLKMTDQWKKSGQEAINQQDQRKQP